MLAGAAIASRRDEKLAQLNAWCHSVDRPQATYTLLREAIQGYRGDHHQVVVSFYKIFSSRNFLTSSAPASDPSLKKTPGWPSGAAIWIRFPLLE